MRESVRVTEITAAPEARSLTGTGEGLEAMGAGVRELLLAHAVGFNDAAPLPPPLGPGADIDALVAEAQAEGYLLADGSLAGGVARALIAGTPAHRVRALQRALVDGLLEGGHPLDGVARALARSGFRDPRLALVLEHAGDEALSSSPALACTLYDEAQAAGADERALAARRAQAAAATGDLDRAGRILDELFAHDEAPDLRRGADVAASVWCRRGMLERGADIYRWLGAERLCSSTALAAVTLVGAGDRETAETMLRSAPSTDSPSVLAAAVGLAARGILQSLEPEPLHALPALIRASDALTAAGVTTVPLPDAPATLAALVALHSGEPEVALAVLDAAIDGCQGGRAALPRLLLVRGWTLMLLDRPEPAQRSVARALEAGFPLVPRDELLLHALEAGLARRSDDRPALVRAWKQARERLLHVSVDLYSLLPLGELLVTSARLRESARLAPHLAEAWALLARLGEPPLWSVPLHWAAVQAAILAERPGEVPLHAGALVHAATASRMASVFAAAGRCWMAVLAGSVDAAAVEQAAHGLASVGLPWDGSRLAGHAAAHADDRREMARLLACARDLHPGAATRTSPSDLQGEGAPAASATTEAAGLSPREREVARLVLEGKTYREIGEAIFISPRTAEHHIARIRRRVGATTRSDLMTRLRVVLDDDTPEE